MLTIHVARVLFATSLALPAADYRVVRSLPVAPEPACMPALTRAPNGDLLVAFSTQWEPFPAGGTLKLVVSRDGGNTWSPPRTLWRDPDPRVTIQVSNGMQTLSNGDILLPVTYCLFHKRPGVPPAETNPQRIYDLASPANRREVRLLRSRDSGRSWTIEDPHLEKPWFRFGRLFEARDGRLIIPGEAWYLASRDFGHTWLPKVSLNLPIRNETNILETAPGTWLALFRQDGELGLRRAFGTTFSHDRGQTWTQWRFAGVQGKMPDLLLLPAGRILLAVGAEGLTDGSLVFSTPNRNSFCSLFTSDDHGQSWHRDLAFQPVTPASAHASAGNASAAIAKPTRPDNPIVPADSPVMCLLPDGRILVVLQAIDRSQAANPLVGYSAGMSLIANIIEPIPQP